jgi:hypothetical protein
VHRRLRHQEVELDGPAQVGRVAAVRLGAVPGRSKLI